MNETKKAAEAAPIETNGKDSNYFGLANNELENFDKGLDTFEAQELEKLRIRNSDNIPAPEPIIEKDEIPIFSKGDFSILVGNPGTRKSWLCLAIAAAFLNDDGFLGFKRIGEKETLLWIDTEQGKPRAAQTARRLNKILCLPENKDLDFSILLDLRDKSFEDRKRILETAIKTYKPQFVILDGLADLITDPNDSKQSSDIVLRLMQLTAKFEIHILAVIHSNVGANDKARGHLGSEALRKCETAIKCDVAPDGESTKCTYQKTRNKRPQEFCFSVCDEIPTLCNYEPKDETDRKELENIFSELLTTEPKTMYKDLVCSVMEKIGKGEKTAKNKIRKAFEMLIIAKGVNGLYYLTPKQEEAPF